MAERLPSSIYFLGFYKNEFYKNDFFVNCFATGFKKPSLNQGCTQG